MVIEPIQVDNSRIGANKVFHFGLPETEVMHVVFVFRKEANNIELVSYEQTFM